MSMDRHPDHYLASLVNELCKLRYIPHWGR